MVSVPALEDLHKLPKAPRGVRVVFGEDDDCNLGLLDSVEKVSEIVPSAEPVVDEGVDPLPKEFILEMAGEVVACVSASETKEHIELGRGSRKRLHGGIREASM